VARDTPFFNVELWGLPTVGYGHCVVFPWVWGTTQNRGTFPGLSLFLKFLGMWNLTLPRSFGSLQSHSLLPQIYPSPGLFLGGLTISGFQMSSRLVVRLPFLRFGYPPVGGPHPDPVFFLGQEGSIPLPRSGGFHSFPHQVPWVGFQLQGVVGFFLTRP